jgi:sporulation protein YlmC with PRC-barrel domain
MQGNDEVFYMRISFSHRLMGHTVLNHDGWALGTIEDLLIDSRTMRPEALRVHLTSEAERELARASVSRERRTLDVPVEMFDLAGDAVMLSVGLAELRTLVEAEEAISLSSPAGVSG